ncbi:unnamed protein product, partial [Rhizoctonia solani]
RRIDLLEKRQRERRDFDLTQFEPGVGCVVQLLCGRKRSEVPWLHVDVFRVPPNRNTLGLGIIRIDGVDRPERIDHGLVVPQRSVRTRLERIHVASRFRIKLVHRSQDRIHIEPGSAVVAVDVRNNVRFGAVPKRLQRVNTCRAVNWRLT